VKPDLLKAQKPDLSVVIPCLNEEDTLQICLDKLTTIAKNEDFSVEVIVADNGSKDSSIQIAKSAGARVVNVATKGYGAALIGGISEAKAPFILMADADDSYDFLETPKFFQKLQEGYDLVQGCRLPKGGGKIEKNAMPWSHRYIGNPLFTSLVRRWFNSPVNDVYCGMRAFTKKFYDDLQMKCTGMEFATEMIIKAANSNAQTIQVPITLYKDGRIQHPPHLKTFRDGWKTLFFFLICAPKKLFFIPGIIMMLMGIAASVIGYSGTSFYNITFAGHTMLGGSLLITCGFQSTLMSFLCSSLSIKLNLKKHQKENILINLIKSNGLIITSVFFVIGLSLWANVFVEWKDLQFGTLNYSSTLKTVIPGATLISLALETLIFTFFNFWIKSEIK
jgi:glycosyltransferase involved in cell wall biosynthesis